MSRKVVEIQCKGRNALGEEVLSVPVTVQIDLRQHKPNGDICVDPLNCPFTAGGHRERCKASHPDQPKVGAGVGCPYSFDYPYILEGKPEWKPPAELQETMTKFETP